MEQEVELQKGKEVAEKEVELRNLEEREKENQQRVSLEHQEEVADHHQELPPDLVHPSGHALSREEEWEEV